jgi:hypothetical protein
MNDMTGWKPSRSLNTTAIQKPVESDDAEAHDLAMEAKLASIEARMFGLESRMDRLDQRMDRLETRLDRVDTRLGGVEQKGAEISGKLDVMMSQVVAKLPTWWQMPVVIGSTVILLGSILTEAQKLHVIGL